MRKERKLWQIILDFITPISRSQVIHGSSLQHSIGISWDVLYRLVTSFMTPILYNGLKGNWDSSKTSNHRVTIPLKLVNYSCRCFTSVANNLYAIIVCFRVTQTLSTFIAMQKWRTRLPMHFSMQDLLFEDEV